MKIIKEKIDISELNEMTEKMFGSLVKAMVDVDKEIMAVDAPLHSDLMELLMQEESCEPQNLWGINIHPDKSENDFIEFDSMMNLKPALGNKSRGVEDENIRRKITEIINKLIVR